MQTKPPNKSISCLVSVLNRVCSKLRRCLLSLRTNTNSSVRITTVYIHSCECLCECVSCVVSIRTWQFQVGVFLQHPAWVLELLPLRFARWLLLGGAVVPFVSLIGPRSADPRPHVELGMLAHIVGISLGLADVCHGRIIVLFLEAIVNAVLVVLDALGFFHAGQQRQGGFRTGLGLWSRNQTNKVLELARRHSKGVWTVCSARTHDWKPRIVGIQKQGKYIPTTVWWWSNRMKPNWTSASRRVRKHKLARSTHPSGAFHDWITRGDFFRSGSPSSFARLTVWILPLCECYAVADGSSVNSKVLGHRVPVL